MTATPLQAQLTRTISIRLTDHDLNRVVAVAEARGLKAPQVIRWAVLEHLERLESDRHA